MPADMNLVAARSAAAQIPWRMPTRSKPRQLAAPQADSPMRLHLVRQALLDPGFGCRRRPHNNAWQTLGLSPASCGYDPIGSVHYCASDSPLGAFWRSPHRVGRRHNLGDRLAHDVLVMVHDHLHSWAWREVAAIDPAYSLAQKPQPDRAEELAFAQLLTEAAACVGLDYWYLCETGLSQRCDLGSNQGPLSTYYRHADLSEYRRFHPTLRILQPQFLVDVVRMYCTDTFAGFGLADMRRSAKLENWLGTELFTARHQRRTTRLWLAQVLGLAWNESELQEPLPEPHARQLELAQVLGHRLWRKVREPGRDDEHRPWNAANLPHPAWRYRPRRQADWRVANIRAGGDPTAALRRLGTTDWSRHGVQSLQYALGQCLNGRALPAGGDEAVQACARLFQETLTQADVGRLLRLLRELPALPQQGRDQAPREMIFVP